MTAPGRLQNTRQQTREAESEVKETSMLELHTGCPLAVRLEAEALKVLLLIKGQLIALSSDSMSAMVRLFGTI